MQLRRLSRDKVRARSAVSAEQLAKASLDNHWPNKVLGSRLGFRVEGAGGRVGCKAGIHSHVRV